MKGLVLTAIAALLATAPNVAAQRSPDTVFLEALTWE